MTDWTYKPLTEEQKATEDKTSQLAREPKKWQGDGASIHSWRQRRIRAPNEKGNTAIRFAKSTRQRLRQEPRDTNNNLRNGK